MIPPIKLAVIFDQVLSVGGGYQQAINAAMLVNRVGKELCIPIYFTIFPENVNILRSHGIEANLLHISRLNRLMLKLRSLVRSRRLLIIINKLFGLNSFEKPLINKNIDLVYFLSPSLWAHYLEKLNFIFTVWDLCHRDHPEFPEVREMGTFEEREHTFNTTLVKATAVLAESKLGKENLVRRYGGDDSRVYVMPFNEASHIKDFDEIDQNKAILIKEKYGISGEYIFYPAQFWSHKNHAYILQGLNVLNKKYDITINAVFSGGDNGNLQYIKQLVEELNLSEQVDFIGFIENEEMPYVYASSIALVMPSYFGPTNIPPLEAFSLGVPVLYSDLPGLREQVKGAALMLDLNNPESMAINLKKLMSDEVLRKDLITAGKNKMALLKDDTRLDIIEEICKNFKSKNYSWDD